MRKRIQCYDVMRAFTCLADARLYVISTWRMIIHVVTPTMCIQWLKWLIRMFKLN